MSNAVMIANGGRRSLCSSAIHRQSSPKRQSQPGSATGGRRVRQPTQSLEGPAEWSAFRLPCFESRPGRRARLRGGPAPQRARAALGYIWKPPGHALLHPPSLLLSIGKYQCFLDLVFFHVSIDSCVDAYYFIRWGLPGDVLAAPELALCGWIGVILLSLSLSPNPN